MKVIAEADLGGLRFVLALGDLFDADVEAIVNSEQTDFVLSRNPASISGQVHRRYGQEVQDQLLAQTQGDVLPPGSVLKTSGGQDYEAIFHVGFHEPHEWSADAGWRHEGDYVEVIGQCTRTVLEMADLEEIRSLAFPLIGCGVFGLNERLLVSQFLDSIELMALRGQASTLNEVWLVVHTQKYLESVVGQLLDDHVALRMKLPGAELPETGIILLDRYAQRVGARASEDWVKWQLCRYSEIATEVMLSILAQKISVPRRPEGMFDCGRPLSFGTTLELAIDLSRAQQDKHADDTALFSRLFDKGRQALLHKLVQARNNLAHGRVAPPLAELHELVIKALQLTEWKDRVAPDIRDDLTSLEPWLAQESSSNDYGIFERWDAKSYRYVVPHTGETFKLAR